MSVIYDQIVVWVEPERINDYRLTATVYFIKDAEVLMQLDSVPYRCILATIHGFSIYRQKWYEGVDKYGRVEGWGPDFKDVIVSLGSAEYGEIIEHQPYKHLTLALEKLLTQKREQYA